MQVLPAFTWLLFTCIHLYTCSSLNVMEFEGGEGVAGEGGGGSGGEKEGEVREVTLGSSEQSKGIHVSDKSLFGSGCLATISPSVYFA